MSVLQEFTADTMRVFIQDGQLRARIVDTVIDDEVAKANPDHVIAFEVNRLLAFGQILPAVFIVSYQKENNATVWHNILKRSGNTIIAGTPVTTFESKLSIDEHEFYFDAEKWKTSNGGWTLEYIGGEYEKQKLIAPPQSHDR